MRLTAVAVLLSAATLSAEPFTCGTSAENDQLVRAASEYVQLRQAHRAGKGSPVKGTRRNVTVQQVIAATGSRSPAYPMTQRSLKVAFVLLTNGDPAPGQLARMQELRRLMARDFAAATGGRAHVTTDFGAPQPRPRRRSVRH